MCVSYNGTFSFQLFFLLLDLDESDIKKVLQDAQIPKKRIRKLMNGEFVPANFSDARFKKKVKVKIEENHFYFYGTTELAAIFQK